MTTKKLQIHSENILPIIKKWLYSDKDIFVRELVSNACDAIHKLKILRDQGKASAKDDEFRIDIQIDKEKKTLTFSDTGIGMDADEVDQYIAQIAFSGAEDFIEKYQHGDQKEQIIGHFGLGFYSSYMAADKVEINTLSYKEGKKAAYWSCDGSCDYKLTEGKKQKRGTEITLHITDENKEFLEEHNLKRILNVHCPFLPYPIYLQDQQINVKPPLWTKSASECSKQAYLEFYRYLYPMEEEPLFWMHLNVDYPFNLKGILYFPKVKRDFDINKASVKLFCNRVFVSDNCKDIIPNYLTVLRGVVDSPDIPLNVSRSCLQTDRVVRQLSSHISKKVSDSLLKLYQTDREKYVNCYEDVSLIIKLGILEDEKFYDRIKTALIWKNTDGKWVTIEEYLKRNKDKTESKIFYIKGNAKDAHLVEMYKNKGIEVLLSTSPLDMHLMHFLESKIPSVKFVRVDAEMHDHLIDKEREKTLLDRDGKTEAAKLAEFVSKNLKANNVEVEAKSLASDTLAGIILFDENQRRMKEYMQAMNPDGESGSFALGDKRKFVVNTNSPLILAAEKLSHKDPELAGKLINEVYTLSLLSQKEIEPQSIDEFVTNTTKLLEQLSLKVST